MVVCCRVHCSWRCGWFRRQRLYEPSHRLNFKNNMSKSHLYWMLGAAAIAYFAPNIIMSVPLVNTVANKSFGFGQSL